MPKQITKVSHIKHDDYASFVAHLGLNGLGLDECRMKLDRLMFAEAKRKNLNLVNEISGGQKVKSQDNTQFVIAAEYLFQTKIENGEIPLKITCSFSALFTTKEKAKREDLERFADNEARLIFWPYLRHLVSDSTYRMALDPVIIPLTVELAVRQELSKKSGSVKAHTRRSSRGPKKGAQP